MVQSRKTDGEGSTSPLRVKEGYIFLLLFKAKWKIKRMVTNRFYIFKAFE